MTYIIETCPKCGSALSNISLTCYPPINKKICRSCGWSWQENNKVVNVPFNEDNPTATEEQDECCAECKYWDSYEAEKNPDHRMWCDGNCHRYPPYIPCMAGITDIGAFVFEEPYKGLPLVDHPVTFGDNWCGEFARR